MTKILAVNGITDRDRAAARALREVLADLSGFWFHPGDDGPLCQALARHRTEAEQALVEKLTTFVAGQRLGRDNPERASVPPKPPKTILPFRRFTDHALSARETDSDGVTSHVVTGLS